MQKVESFISVHWLFVASSQLFNVARVFLHAMLKNWKSLQWIRLGLSGWVMVLAGYWWHANVRTFWVSVHSAVSTGSVLVSMAVQSPSNRWRFSWQVYLHLERLQWPAEEWNKDRLSSEWSGLVPAPPWAALLTREPQQQDECLETWPV